jgi:hypothetical protein
MIRLHYTYRFPTSESASSKSRSRFPRVRQTSAGVSTLHVLNFRPSWP